MANYDYSIRANEYRDKRRSHDNDATAKNHHSKRRDDVQEFERLLEHAKTPCPTDLFAFGNAQFWELLQRIGLSANTSETSASARGGVAESGRTRSEELLSHTPATSHVPPTLGPFRILSGLGAGAEILIALHAHSIVIQLKPTDRQQKSQLEKIFAANHSDEERRNGDLLEIVVKNVR